MLHNLNTKKIIFLVLSIIAIVLAFNIHSQAPALLSAEFKNPDSYEKLVLVRDWQPVAGYQYMARDGAPHGSYLHWSMLHTWTMQHLAWGLEWLDIQKTHALLWAGGGLTLASLLFLVLLSSMAVLQLGGRLAAIATTLALLTSHGLLAYGQLLQITHHIFMLLPLAAAAWLIFGKGKDMLSTDSRLFMAGLCLGTALWISPETMPLATGLAAIQAGRRLQYPSTGHCWPLAAGLSLICITAWLIDPPPPGFSAWALDHISLTWLAWVGVLAFLLCLADRLALRTRLSLSGKALILAVTALTGAGLWLLFTPGVLAGPTGLLPPELKTLWWDHINELRPARKVSEIIGWAALPAVAGLLLLHRAWQKHCLWWAILACTAMAYAAMAAWHLRMGAAASLTGALAWGTWLCGQQAFICLNPGQLPVKAQHRAALLLLFPVILLILSLTSVYIEDPTNLTGSQDKQQCKLSDIAEALNQLPPSIILLPLNDAPQLLWRTHHRVIAGNYHHNTQGMLDFFHFWQSKGEDKTAKHIVTKRKINYLLVCENATANDDYLGSRAKRGEQIDWMANPRKLGHWLLYKINH